MFDCLLPHTAFPADSIERSADMVEAVFLVRVMAAPQSDDGDLVLLDNGRLSNLWFTFIPHSPKM